MKVKVKVEGQLTLKAERFSSSRREQHESRLASDKQSFDNLFLQKPERWILAVAREGRAQVGKISSRSVVELNIPPLLVLMTATTQRPMHGIWQPVS